MTRLSTIVLILLLMLCAREGIGMEPAIKVLHASEASAENLLQNGDLEKMDGKSIRAWSPYKQGYEVANEAGRGGSKAAYCETKPGTDGNGIFQSVQLDRRTTTPIMVKPALIGTCLELLAIFIKAVSTRQPPLEAITVVTSDIYKRVYLHSVHVRLIIKGVKCDVNR